MSEGFVEMSNFKRVLEDRSPDALGAAVKSAMAIALV